MIPCCTKRSLCVSSRSRNIRRLSKPCAATSSCSPRTTLCGVCWKRPRSRGRRIRRPGAECDSIDVSPLRAREVPAQRPGHLASTFALPVIHSCRSSNPRNGSRSGPDPCATAAARCNYRTPGGLPSVVQSLAARDWPQAIAQLKEALQVCGNCSALPLLHKDLGLIYCRSGDWKNGKSELLEARKLTPNDPDVAQALRVLEEGSHR